MAIERDPFSNEEIRRTAGVIALTSTLDFIDITGSPINGDTGTITMSPKALGQHLVLSTGTTGRVSARMLTAADLPVLSTNDVSDLDAVLDSKISNTRTINTISPLSGGGNLSADRTISIAVGTVGGTVAAGNDSRFPANFSGLRKARLNLSDIAAVPKTDYWDTSIFVGSGGSHAIGLVPDPGASAGVTKFLREDASWAVPAGGGGGTATIANTTLVIKGDNAGNGVAAVLGTDYWDNSNFVASGGSHAKGLVPDPGATAGTTAFLCENATWIDITTMVASGGSHAGGLVPDPGAAAGTTAFLREDATWVDITDFGASGTNHKSGLVPDPGAAEGFTRFLREDGGWAVPAGGGGGATIALTTSVLKGDGLGNGIAAVARTDFWDTTIFVASGGSNAKGLVPAPGGTIGNTKFLREDATWAVPASASGTVTSVALAVPTGYTVSGSPITTSGTLTIIESTQSAGLFKAGPVSGPPSVPTYREISSDDLPIGTSSTTVAVGNDTRFPASVTGIRKGAGVGSSDAAAVAKTDYWDTTVFIGSGAFHSKGLVPDPGGTAGTTRFLREDGTWQPSTYTTTLSGAVTGSGGASIVTSISTGAVGTTQLADLGVTSGKIADLAVTSGKIGTGAVTTTKLGDLSITADKLQSSSVISSKIASDAVLTSHIADGAVTASQIGAGQVQEDAIGTSEVTPTKLGYEVVTVSGTTIDCSAGNAFKKNQLGSASYSITNMTAGQHISVKMIGAYDPTFTGVKWINGTVPTRVGSVNIYLFWAFDGSIYGSLLPNLL